MTEAAYPIDELETFQALKRRGSCERWVGGKLRKAARVVVGYSLDRSTVSMLLGAYRDVFNSAPQMIESEVETTEVAVPPTETLRALGASSCRTSTIIAYELNQKDYIR